MDFSGSFVAFFEQRNSIPVRKSDLINRFWNYKARTVRQLLYHKSDTDDNCSGFKGNQVLLYTGKSYLEVFGNRKVTWRQAT